MEIEETTTMPTLNDYYEMTDALFSLKDVYDIQISSFRIGPLSSEYPSDSIDRFL